MRSLTIDKKIGYIVAIAILAASIIVLFVPTKMVLWSAALLFAISAPTVCVFVRKRSIHSFNKRQVLLIMAVIAALFLMLYYLSGISFGFARVRSRFRIDIVYQYILPILAVIFLTEIVRDVLIAQGSIGISIVTYFIGVITELLIAGGVQSVSSAYKFADFLGMALLPAITGNLLYHYISKRYGMMPNLAYRLILTLYYYIIPIIPNVPQVLPAFCLLILPVITRAFIDILFEKKRKRAKQGKSKLGFITTVVIIALLVPFVLLVSCQFRFGIVVIATGSMSDEINRGDAVVYEAYEDCTEPAKENDVIIFTDDGERRVVHRVIEINNVNGQRQYITKGDANENPDSGFVTDSQIIGVVRFKVLYIGYPSLWLREIFN